MNSRADRKRRVKRIKRIKRNRMLRRLRFYALIIFLISLSIFGFNSGKKNKGINEAASMENLSQKEIEDNAHLLIPKSEHKDLGDLESIIEYGENGLIGVHYPVFDKKNIDAISKKLVNKYIEDFKSGVENNSYQDEDYKYELSIDYEIYKGPKDIISINFDIIKNSSYLAHPDINTETKVYDLSKDKEVDLDSIMKGEYLKYISQFSKDYFAKDETYKEAVDSELFEEGIYPSKENYSHFILKENKIAFIFEKYQLFSGYFGITSVEVPYVDLKDYIETDLFEAFTGEKKLEKTELETDRQIPEIIIPDRIIDPDKAMIALTFDDGPNKNTTVPILDTLKEYDSAATFFILGNRVSDNIDILERMLEEGSEIGNHSFSHKELTKLSYEGVREQIIDTQDAVVNSTGITPKLMRPTYGSYDDNIKSMIEMPLILWSIDTLDWKSRDSQKITNHVLENVKDGDIILMHDIYDSTSEAVKTLVPKLIDRGYQLVTVSELFESRGEVLKDGELYYQMHKN